MTMDTKNTAAHPQPGPGRRQVLGWLAAGGLTGGQALAAAPAAPGPGPDFLLARVCEPGLAPAPYLVSEKFDGVRAQWDGRQLWLRSGLTVAAPAFFLARLPRQALDGELWLGRRRFDELSGIVRKNSPQDSDWRDVRYLVFELPGAPGPFTQRTRQIETLVRRTGWPALQAVAQRRVPDNPALQRLLAQTLRQGGEGLMLHLASAPYLTGRSEVLRKLKPQLDAEATVVAHRPGKGRHAGRLGALVVETPDRRRFALGTGFTDAERSHPPAIGSTVTYRYRELTPTGLPRFASFLRVAVPD